MKKSIFLLCLLLIAAVFCLTSCGEDAGTPSENLSYELSADGESYVVTGIGTCEDLDLVIPAEHEGKPVTAVADMAFSMNESIHSVSFGKVTSIGNSAFAHCANLTTLSHMNSVTDIGPTAFSGCENLTTVSSLASVKNIGPMAFNGCQKLSSPLVLSSLTTIDIGAFERCSALETVTIGKNVTVLYAETFFLCSSLKTLNLPASITEIGGDCFANCPELVIHYKGTKAQWEAITKQRNHLPTSYTVECTDGTVTISE